MYTITIQSEDDAVPSKQIEKIKEGSVLLEVLLQNRVAIRHDCGGVCHCTTCHVLIEAGENFFSQPTKREQDFLKRVKNRKENSRLACQCLLETGRGEVVVIV